MGQICNLKHYQRLMWPRLMRWCCPRMLTLCLLGLFLVQSSLTVSDIQTLQRSGLGRGTAVGSLISEDDMQQRQALERSFQVAAFEQFDHHKTGQLYSVTGFEDIVVQAIRLRVGSFKKYGVVINGLSIPHGCVVIPTPERMLLVYAKLSNTSLFGDLPDGRSVVSSVLTISAYDASNLKSIQLLEKLSVTTTQEMISIRFSLLGPGVLNTSCVLFGDNSTAVAYMAVSQNVCHGDKLGIYAVVGNVSSSIVPAYGPRTPQLGRRSGTWEVVMGCVVGGVVVLVLLSLLLCIVNRHRKNVKLSMMQHQADQGEVLETAQVQNSRAPAAGGTRTQPGLENEFAMR